MVIGYIIYYAELLILNALFFFIACVLYELVFNIFKLEEKGHEKYKYGFATLMFLYGFAIMVLIENLYGIRLIEF